MMVANNTCVSRKVNGWVLFAVGFCFLILLFGIPTFNLRTRLSASENFDWSKENILGRKTCITDCITGYKVRCLSEGHVKATEPLTRTSTKWLEGGKERQAAFEKVYSDKQWVNKGDQLDPKYKDVQGSGAGSSLEWAQEAIGVLHRIITELKRAMNKDTISMLDIPCGDMVWMNRFLQTRSDIEYVGMDIVPNLISKHSQRYSKFAKWSFVHQDIVEQSLNRSFDLIFCRMMLQHLSIRDAEEVLLHFSQSGSRFLLTTTFPSQASNSELPLKKRGRFRLLNLELPPFSLRAPICITRDGDVSQVYHYLGLWELPLSRISNCNANNTVKTRDPTRSSLVFHSCS